MRNVIAFWRALDDRFEKVRMEPWGAVVTDARFPAIWDVNYARVERVPPALTPDAVYAALEPELERVGALHRHAVVFEPDAGSDLLTDATTRGATVTRDAVMALGPREMRALEDRSLAGAAVEEVRSIDDPFLDEVRASLEEFDVTDDDVSGQLMAIERAVLLPAGNRWFRISDGGRTAALGSLLRIGSVALVDHVVTLPFARGRGYATDVVTTMAREAAAAGVTTVYLLTEPDGGARRIYDRVGFRHLRTIASIRERRDG